MRKVESILFGLMVGICALVIGVSYDQQRRIKVLEDKVNYLIDLNQPIIDSADYDIPEKSDSFYLRKS